MDSIQENSVDARPLINHISLFTNGLQDRFLQVGDDYLIEQFKEQNKDFLCEHKCALSTESDLQTILMSKVRPKIHKRTEIFNQLKRVSDPQLFADKDGHTKVIEFLAQLRAAIYPYATGFEKELVKESLEMAIILREVVGSLATEPIESPPPTGGQ